MPLTESVISEAYQSLAKARADHWQAAEQLAERRSELQSLRARRVAEGLIDGRNETERDAKARTLLADLYAAVEEAEAAERKAALAVELCRIEIDRVQALLRFAAVGAGKPA